MLRFRDTRTESEIRGQKKGAVVSDRGRNGAFNQSNYDDMTEEEKSLLLMERDISCNSNKIKEIKEEFVNRNPAKTTFEFINKTNIAMAQQTDKLDNIVKTLDTHIEDQKIHDGKLQVKLEEYQIAIFKKFDETQKTMADFINSSDLKYADSEQFRFWRNVLILGLIVSIAVGVIGIWIDKILN